MQPSIQPCYQCGQPVRATWQTNTLTEARELLEWPPCHCPPGDCECEPEWVSKDVSWTIEGWVTHCPQCGTLIHD